MTSSWVRTANEKMVSEGKPPTVSTCSFFDSFEKEEEVTLPSGVYDLDALRVYGTAKGWCPYYLTRRCLNHANVLVFNYQYMLDPKVSKMVSKELEGSSIIVFDEAHNLDNICIEALSVEINAAGLEKAGRSLGRVQAEVARVKATDAAKLQVSCV